MLLEIHDSLPVFRLQIVGFLSLRDIVMLDTAWLMKSTRSDFLKKLSGSVCYEHIFLSTASFRWLVSRSVLLCNLDFARWYCYHDHEYPSNASRVLAPFLIGLEIHNGDKLVDERLMHQLALCASTLQSITLTRISDKRTGELLLDMLPLRLRHITLIDFQIDIFVFKRFLSKHQAELRSLYIGTPLTTHLECIASNCPKLESLRMSLNNVAVASVLELMNRLTLQCTSLKRIDLSLSRELPERVVVDLARNCHSRLEYLSLRGCKRISDDALMALAQYCPNLAYLDLTSCKEKLSGAVISMMSNLKCLKLVGCCAFEGLSLLGGGTTATGNPPNHISDSNAGVIPNGRGTGLSKLEVLDISGIGPLNIDEVMQLLLDLKPQLKALYCRCCTFYKQEGSEVFDYGALPQHQWELSQNSESENAAGSTGSCKRGAHDNFVRMKRFEHTPGKNTNNMSWKW